MLLLKLLVKYWLLPTFTLALKRSVKAGAWVQQVVPSNEEVRCSLKSGKSGSLLSRLL